MQSDYNCSIPKNIRTSSNSIDTSSSSSSSAPFSPNGPRSELSDLSALFSRREGTIPTCVPLLSPISAKNVLTTPTSQVSDTFALRMLGNSFPSQFDDYQTTLSQLREGGVKKQTAIDCFEGDLKKATGKAAIKTKGDDDKDRYPNVCPAISTAIRGPGYPPDYYLNGNRIALHSQCYLALQAPLTGTREDFWRAIANENVKVIAMLTRFFEAGHTKAHLYWPLYQQPANYGPFTILERSQEEEGNIIKRTFNITNEETGESREVVHLHFMAWPDQGVIKPEQFVELLDKIDREQGNHEGPIAVHCSAGVGRTGTVITAHSLRKHVEEELANGRTPDEIAINVPATILEGRKQRHPLFVQTGEQCASIYEALAYAFNEQTREKDRSTQPETPSSSILPLSALDLTPSSLSSPTQGSPLSVLHSPLWDDLTSSYSPNPWNNERSSNSFSPLHSPLWEDLSSSYSPGPWNNERSSDSFSLLHPEKGEEGKEEERTQ